MYSFKIDVAESSILVIFSGQLEVSDIEYGDQIDHIFKCWNRFFDEVVFLFPEYIATNIESYLNDGNRLSGGLERAKDTKQISLYTFNGYAELTLHRKWHPHLQSADESYPNFAEHLVKSGIHALVEKRKAEVILKSPPGTVFQKPSGQNFREFMKASALAVGYSENQFVAFCLLSHRPKDVGDSLREILIDTAGLSAFVESLIYYIKQFSGSPDKQVKYKSFQSYGNEDTEGYQTHQPDDPLTVWVIISASRSNALGTNILNTWEGVKHDQIVTLISYADSRVGDSGEPINPGDRIIANISCFSEFHNSDDQHSTEVPIKIVGENFTAQIKEPNKVLLRKVHNVAINEFVRRLYSSDIFLVNKSSNGRLHSVFFDFCKFLNIEPENEDLMAFRGWLKDIVNWYIPISVNWIVYDFTDEASKALYNAITPMLEEQGTKAVDTRDIKKINNTDCVVILAPVISQGHSLIKLNSDLRLAKHEGQRIFIAPFVTPSSRAVFKIFEKSLKLGPRGLSYQLFSFKKFFLGKNSDCNAWSRELDIVQNFSHESWIARATHLSTKSEGITEGIGFSLDKPVGRLPFSIGFAFWSDKYNPCNTNESSVYVTMAILLQNLRDKPLTELNNESLFKHVYQHSVLDPQNFSRFNDGLLQSCLWRAAHDSELNYEDCPDLSGEFSDIVRRLAEDYVEGSPNAIVDLLLGIAVGRIKLERGHKESLVSDLVTTLDSKKEVLELLNFIAGGAQSPPAEIF